MEEIKNGLYDAVTADAELAEALEADLASLETAYGIPVLGLIPREPVRKRWPLHRKRNAELKREER